MKNAKEILDHQIDKNANESSDKNIESDLNSYIEKTLKSMTLEEKIGLCSGKNEWDTKSVPAKSRAGKSASERDALVKGAAVKLPSVKVADGPHGLRKTVGQGDNLGLASSEPATCFPAESLVACSFDKELAGKMGAAIADEARAAGVSTVLGPGVNIKRNPLCGRNFEYYSEDPYVSGRMASAFIKGMEERGIGSSIKHFACNSQEYFRMTSDSQVEERALREIYLPAFEYAIKEAKPTTVMCAYNKLNGTACSDNVELLDSILRKEWGYEGLVVSDWGALNNRINGFKAGCDLAMPGGSGFEEGDVKDAVKAGSLSESYVDRSARRVMKFALTRHALLADKKGRFVIPEAKELQKKNHLLAQEIAENSIVLLKNEDEILPVDFEEVCLIGSMADNYRYQGSGSSKINPTKVEKLRSLVSLPYAAGYDKSGKTSVKLIKEAAALAKKSKKVVLFAGLPEQYEAEGMDRRSMALPEGQNQLIEAVAAANHNVIVVLVCGCVVELPWADKVDGIIWAGLAGQAGAKALARILTGEVNPSGRLAETWPMTYQDVPSAATYLLWPDGGKDASYKEGIFVGYRYYEKKKLRVRFPFGHGLSYTSFEYSNLKITKEGDRFRIAVDVTNTGAMRGGEAVLLFVRTPQDGPERPVRELKGFEKIYLEPGETKTLEFVTDDRTFATWNQGWKTYEGSYGIEIGTCRSKIFVKGEPVKSLKKAGAGAVSEEKTAGEKTVTKAQEIWKLIEEECFTEKYDVNSTIQEVSKDVLLLRLIYRWFETKQAKTYGKGSVEYLSAMSAADECPLRGVQQFLGLKGHFAQAIADFGNKKILRGIRHLIR